MGRQLFLHHYLPAHLASTLVTGALLEFIFIIEPIGPDDDSPTTVKSGEKKKLTSAKRTALPARQRLQGQSLIAAWSGAAVIISIAIGGWYYFLPLTYGYPGLSVEQVVARKWLGYDLHFAK